ncbi:hypothetical protein KFE25_003849 [Diacronema lutheri]|uniref:AB hydrolase-1 domain-containing protein n=1 Tax=Diacronema lutheri TaxID=2081491 RepID=A0A8J5XDH3_DIALT|nr:hypothetical protein KFE25_003849 [Diacronema lutheri]
MARASRRTHDQGFVLCVCCLVPVAAGAAVIRHATIDWPGRPGLRVHYTRAAPQVAPPPHRVSTSESPSSSAAPRSASGGDASPLVCLPGFGVGTFHFTAQLEQLGIEREAYALDWLGQGESWPVDDEAERGLRYDADLWREQLEAFLDSVLDGRPAILVGNSLGGYIAVQLALKRPELVRGLVLLNPTPIWSFAPPARDVGALRPFGWDATLPAPRVPFLIGSTWFHTLRDPRTIATMLGAVYADKRAVARTSNRLDDARTAGVGGEDSLPEAIARAASKRGGHAAFTSILFSPRTETSFEAALEALSALKSPPPIALLYGREDPRRMSSTHS